jgi:hypothetical protein
MPQMPQMPQMDNGGRLLEQITRQVFIVVLHCSWPKLKYQIADAVVAVTDEDDKKTEIDSEFRTDPQWSLMPAAWSKKLTNLESRIRSTLSVASIQFAAARGMAVLPVTRAADVFRNLRMLRTEMEQQRDAFVAEYTKILATLQEKLGKELYAKAAKRLPDIKEIASKFSVVWAIVPTGGHRGIKEEQLNLLNRAIDAAVEFAECLNKQEPKIYAQAKELLQQLRAQQSVTQITDQEADELVREAHVQMQQFTREMLEDMAREPRRVLLDAADNLIEALSDRTRVVRTGTIDQVRRAFEMVEGFSFLAGPELLQRIRDVREGLDNATPQTLNSDSEVGAALAAGLLEVREAAADAQAAAEAMRNFRGIRIRDRNREEVAV